MYNVIYHIICDNNVYNIMYILCIYYETWQTQNALKGYLL